MIIDSKRNEVLSQENLSYLGMIKTSPHHKEHVDKLQSILGSCDYEFKPGAWCKALGTK